MSSYSKFERAAAGLLEVLPGVKPVLKQAYQRLNYLFFRERGFRFALHPGVRLMTPTEWAGIEAGAESREELFFGYYDKSPWSPDGTRFLCHRLVPPDSGAAGPAVEIMLYDRAARCTRVLGRTVAWNLQQGAMLQWLPGSAGRKILFNDRVEGKLAVRILTLPPASGFPLSAEKRVPNSGQNCNGSIESSIPWPVQAVHPAGREALTLNYRRLAALRPEYGYAVAAENFAPDQPSAEDGIWRIDLNTGRGKLVLSLDFLAAYRPRPEMENARHKVNHLLYSPGGSRFAFVHRWFGPRGKSSRLYTAVSDGSGLRLHLDQRMVSHYCWFDEERLLVWGRAPEAGDHYYCVNMATGEREIVGSGLLDRYGDGHPNFSPNDQWILTDSYPDRRRQRRLLLYRPQTGTLIEAGRFLEPWKFNGPGRCDLHPRWNHSQNGAGLVSFDSTHSGRRGTYILDLNAIMDGFTT